MAAKYQDIAAVWIKKGKDGETYLSMKVSEAIPEGSHVSLYKNDKGGVPTRPDFRAYRKIEEEGATKQFDLDIDDIPF
jgi:uncharacterized protein (DUF736 family)